MPTNRRGVLGTLTEALARRGDTRAKVRRGALPLVAPESEPVPVASTADTERSAAPTSYGSDAAGGYALGERLGDRFAAARAALDALHKLAADDAPSRAALVVATGELACTLVRARRSVRAAATELAALEAEARPATVLAQGRLRRRCR